MVAIPAEPTARAGDLEKISTTATMRKNFPSPYPRLNLSGSIKNAEWQ